MALANSDEEPELEEAMAQLSLEPVLATFEKPEDDRSQYLKALFLKGNHLYAMPVNISGVLQV